MDIHPPERPIHSVKDFFIQIFTIIVGILIALGLEQAVEAYHHRQLAEEARVNITNELRDNKNEVDNLIEGMKKIEQDHRHVLVVLNQLLMNRHIKTDPLSLQFEGIELSSTSWMTAQTVGAFSFMDYQKVKTFAEAYGVQQEFQRIQNNTFDANGTAMDMLVDMEKGLDKMTDEEIREAKREVARSIAAYLVYDQVAKQLNDKYAEVLSKKVTHKK